MIEDGGDVHVRQLLVLLSLSRVLPKQVLMFLAVWDGYDESVARSLNSYTGKGEWPKLRARVMPHHLTMISLRCHIDVTTPNRRRKRRCDHDLHLDLGGRRFAAIALTLRSASASAAARLRA